MFHPKAELHAHRKYYYRFNLLVYKTHTNMCTSPTRHAHSPALAGSPFPPVSQPGTPVLFPSPVQQFATMQPTFRGLRCDTAGKSSHPPRTFTKCGMGPAPAPDKAYI